MAILMSLGKEPEVWGKCEWIVFLVFFKGKLSEIYIAESNPLKTGCKEMKFACCWAAFMWQRHVCMHVCDAVVSNQAGAKSTSDLYSSRRSPRRETLACSISLCLGDSGAFRWEKRSHITKHRSISTCDSLWSPGCRQRTAETKDADLVCQNKGRIDCFGCCDFLLY